MIHETQFSGHDFLPPWYWWVGNAQTGGGDDDVEAEVTIEQPSTKRKAGKPAGAAAALPDPKKQKSNLTTSALQSLNRMTASSGGPA